MAGGRGVGWRIELLPVQSRIVLTTPWYTFCSGRVELTWEMMLALVLALAQAYASFDDVPWLHSVAPV